MKAELLDKEVLCILDTRQIQKYIFRTNAFIDTLGGSDLLLHILQDAILYGLKNIDEPLSEEEYDISIEPEAEVRYFTSDKVKFQLIMNNAGNALCLVRTGRLCQKIVRKISRYYLEHGYSLNLASAVTEKTQNFGNDIFHLYKNLDAIKAAGDISNPLETLPVVMREDRTGEPVVGMDEISGEYISGTSRVRRMEARKRAEITDYAEIRTTTASDGKEYKAVIHADGNNLGITIGGILQRSKDYKESITIRRIINRNIDNSIKKVVEETVRELKENYVSEQGSDEGFEKEFYPVHLGGDDVNVMCNANIAFKFAEIFFKNLKGKYIWETPEGNVPLYACMGIAFVTPENTFGRSFELAEECCKSAKTIAKLEENLRDGLAGNWTDYQICDNPNVQELELLRENTYVTAEKVNLLLRPYCMDEDYREDKLLFSNFVKRVERYNRLPLTDDMQKLMKRSYGVGKQFFTQCINAMEETGIKLTEQLGSPLFSMEGEQHAVWYDAVEASDFLKERAGD